MINPEANDNTTNWSEQSPSEAFRLAITGMTEEMAQRNRERQRDINRIRRQYISPDEFEFYCCPPGFRG